MHPRSLLSSRMHGKVLFETEKDGVSVGHGENYIEVKVSAAGLRRLVKKVKITAAEGEMLVGTVL